MSTRVLITGATGFLGRGLVRWIQSSSLDWDPTGASRRPARNVIPLIKCDLRSWYDTAALLKKVRPEIIFHCAGACSGDWPTLYEKQVTATANLLMAAQQSGLSLSKIVIAGSAAEYGAVPKSRQPIKESEPPRPLAPYSAAKACQTAVARAFNAVGLPVVVARIFNLLGPGVSPDFAAGRFAELIRQARRQPGLAARTGPLDSFRDFLPLDSACEALAALARRGKNGEIYNVCSGRPVRMREVFQEMARHAGVKLRLREARRGSSRSAAQSYVVGSPRKIERDTGWRPARDWRPAVPEILD